MSGSGGSANAVGFPTGPEEGLHPGAEGSSSLEGAKVPLNSDARTPILAPGLEPRSRDEFDSSRCRSRLSDLPVGGSASSLGNAGPTQLSASLPCSSHVMFNGMARSGGSRNGRSLPDHPQTSSDAGFGNFPVEKIVWDYIHLLHRQDGGRFSYLSQYVDDTFNVGKFHCLVTEYCKRERCSRDALIIQAKGWFRGYVARKENETALAPNITLEEGIKRYLSRKLRRYVELGFSLDRDAADIYCGIFVCIVKGLWERLEEASFDRVDWSLRPYLRDEEDRPGGEGCGRRDSSRSCVSRHDCDLVTRVMRLNETEEKGGSPRSSRSSKRPSRDAAESCVEEGKSGSGGAGGGDGGRGGDGGGGGGGDDARTDGENREPDSKTKPEPARGLDSESGEPEQGRERLEEMIVVSRTQKWLLRSVRLSDFRHVVQMDDLYDKLPPPRVASGGDRRIRLPKRVRGKLMEMMTLHYSSTQ